jgi:FkbM family methyltransferase
VKALLRKATVAGLKAGLRFTGETGRRLVAEAQAQSGESLLEVIEHVTTSRGRIAFYCLGDLALWRARTLLKKEPETIEWIDDFQDGDVFWDVGANIGVYTLYAAITRKVEVLAFEPSASNYLLLNRNVEINRLSDRVRAYCMAFAGETRLDALNMQSTQFGGAMSSFAEKRDHMGEEFIPTFRQGAIGFAIDDFIASFNPPFPNHLKIDVDGIEDRIVAGARKTLSDPRLRSISIELEANRIEYTLGVLARLEAAGYELVSKRHAEMFEGGPFADVYNYRLQRSASSPAHDRCPVEGSREKMRR